MTCLVVFSQKREIVNLRKYTQKDGLSSYNIRKILQDKWGFLWVATQDGLSRFDGRSFTNYTKNSAVKNRISGTDVRELIEDTAQSLLWVLPGEVGIDAISTITGEVVTSIRIPYTNHDEWNISMIKEGKEIWVGTSTGIKIYNMEKRKFAQDLTYPKKPKQSIDFAVRSIATDNHGNIWGCYDRYGIVIYNAKTKSVIKEIRINELNDYKKSKEIRFNGVVVLKDQILFATNQGLRRINYSSSYQLTIDNYPCKTDPTLNTKSIEYLKLDKKNDLYASGFGQLYKFDKFLTNFTVIEEAAKSDETDWLNAVHCIYNDLENNIWLGCQEGVAFLAKGHNPFRPYNYDKISNTTLSHVRSIFPLPNGDILVGLINGIIHINHSTQEFSKYDTRHLYHHLFADKKGVIIASRNDGIFIFNKGRLRPISQKYGEFAPYASIPINSHLFIDDTTIIFGSENNNGILIWNPTTKRVRQMLQGAGPDSLSSNIVNNIYRDVRGNIWVLSDNVINILSPNLKKRKELVLTDIPNKLPFKLFFDMCEANGTYWITSYGTGILQLDSKYNLIKTFSTGEGLSNAGVYQIFNYLNKKLLITSNNGLSVLNLQSLKFKQYFNEDGLHSSAFEEVCGLDKDGLIYTGGLKGFTIIDPSKFTNNTVSPKFYFTNKRIQLSNKTFDTTNLNIGHLKIEKNWLQANISFIGQNYSNPNRVTYEYRIKERDTLWVNNGTENSVNLIGLPPGSYTVEVKAANEDGYWSAPKQLIVIIEPKWFETVWFEVAALLGVSSLLYLIYRYRVNQIKQQHLIRKNIASDLHDDIGSTLNTIKVFTHLAKRDSQKQEYLGRIEEALTDATSGLRDMIWVLDDTRDNLGELIERIKKFAIPFSSANNIKFECTADVDIDDELLTKPEKRNLLLMIKEAINNSIKYANCCIISIDFTRNENKKLWVIIRDDGKGFSSNDYEGNGLKNLHHRAGQIKYKVEINSIIGHGTSITIKQQ